MKKIILLLLVALSAFSEAEGQESLRLDSVQVFFRQGSAYLDPFFRDNGRQLEAFARRFRRLREDGKHSIRGIRIVSSASPEGSTSFNKQLSEKRGQSIISFMNRRFFLEPSLFSVIWLGADWEGLARLVRSSEYMPYRYEVLDILRYTPEVVVRNQRIVEVRKKRLMELGGGTSWRYMNDYLFSHLRTTIVHIWYETDQEPSQEPPQTNPEKVIERDTVILASQDCSSSFYMAVKTNLLYDLALIPNFGVEFPLFGQWSAVINGQYAWWSSDKRHRYWRIYGGDMEIRYRFGQNADYSLFVGHHLGVYGQLLSYDFELGNKGYLGGRWTYGGGLAYGYSFPISRRLNLDFTLGIGYLQGKCDEYIPGQGRYEREYIRRDRNTRKWFGPTKAELSLVWQLGCENINRKKGGKR